MVEISSKGNMTEYKVVYGCPCDCGQDVDGGHTKREINKLLKEQMENPLKPLHDLFIMCVDKVVWKYWELYDEDIEWLHPLQDASLLDGALYGAPCPIHEPLSFSVWKMKKKAKEMN
tara:strand:+ start:228 stop:578 length:351 start_codon:yes stop_codon:yes gene_type:complete